MPELPEVETIRRDLKKYILDSIIEGVLLTKKVRIQNMCAENFCSLLINNKFTGIDRIGKLLILPMADKEKYLLIHLKMTGQLIFEKNKKIIAGGHSIPSQDHILPNNFTRATIVFKDMSRLFFNDMRRFGYFKIVDGDELQIIKSGFGIEPLTTDYVFDKFAELLKNRKTNIKALLLNQKIVSGLGNIYVDEVLFDTGILPSRRVDSLTLDEKKRIFYSAERIIKKAIEMRGTTFNDYVDADGKVGNFVQYLQVFHRQGEKCYKCKSHNIEKTKLAGRGTHYCPNCQI